MADVGTGKNEVLNTQTPPPPDATNKLQQDANNMSLLTKAGRVGEVTGLGIVNAIPGAVHAVEHDLDPANWKETGFKVLSAATLGIAMRTLLPESGAVKAIVGTAMGLYFAKDAAMPLIHAWGNVTTDGSSQVMDQQSKIVGDSLGSFAVDGYLTAKIAGFTGDMTPKWGEKYAPTQWNALESWKAENIGAGSPLGVKLGGWATAVSDKAHAIGDKLDPPKVSPTDISNLSKEDIMAAIARSKEDNIARARAVNIYKNGVQGSDGMSHGLDGTYDLLMKGQDPRTVRAVAADVPDADITSAGQMKGFTKTANVKVQPEDVTHAPMDATAKLGAPLLSEEDLAGASLVADEAGVKGKAGRTGRTGRGSTAPKDGGDSTVKTTDAPIDPTNPTERYLNPKTMTQMAGVIRAVLASQPDQLGLIQDALNRPTEAIHIASDQNFKPLDPAYQDARDAAVSLASQVGDDPRALAQVHDLLVRYADAASQGTSSDLGFVQQYVKEMNIASRENYTTYARNIAQALNVTDASDVLKSKKPPLYEVSSDLEQIGVKDGKPVFAHQGPHTVRQIEGPNGEQVWPIDLIKKPIREVDLRAILDSGIFEHEEFHDQYGSLGKLSPAQREAGLGAAADKALGADANKVIHLPGGGKPVLGEDGQPMTDMPTLPATITQKELYVALAKAWADETFADWGAASRSGQSAAPYFQALRKTGQLMNGTVMGEEMRSPSNPFGIEAHPVDALRPHIQAMFIDYLSGGKDQRLTNWAEATRNYADGVSPAGDTISLASIEHPGAENAVTFSKSQFLDFMKEVVPVQLRTPLDQLKGHTLFEILPDLRKSMAKTDAMSDSWVQGIKDGRDPSTVPFDINTTKMDHVRATGQPTFLKLVADGMNPMKALQATTQYRDYFASKYADGDPHIDPIHTPFSKALQIAPRAAISEIPSRIVSSLGDGIRNQNMLRDWTAKQAVPLSAMGGSQMLQDLVGMKKKQDEMLSTASDQQKGS